MGRCATLERSGIAREKKDVTFMLANGQRITRSLGFAIIRVHQHFTIDEVVFAEAGDLQILGARTLEGLNLTINPSGGIGGAERSSTGRAPGIKTPDPLLCGRARGTRPTAASSPGPA